MMRYQLGIGVLLVAAFAAQVAMADPIDLITYKITFTGAGLNPTAGSFTYDPDTPHFTNFTVIWDSTIFDLTNSANAPITFGGGFPPCIGALTGAAAGFALLDGACFPPTNANPSQWFADSSASAFEFFASNTATTHEIRLQQNDLPISGTLITAGGQWSISPASGNVPEPSTIVVMPVMLLLFGFVARKRIAGLRLGTRTNR